MKETRKSEAPRFKVKSRLFYVPLIILPVLILMSGCSAPTHKVVASWRGEVISKKRINEQRECYRPVLNEIDWNSKSGTISLYIEQNCIESFDLENKYKINQVARVLSSQDALTVGSYEDKFTRALATAELWGLWAGAADKKNAELEKDSINKIKSGVPQVTVDFYGYFPWGVGPANAKSRYVRETSNKTEEEILEGQTSKSVMPACNTPVKVVNNKNDEDEITIETDKIGVALLPVAQSFHKAKALKSTSYDVFVEWQSKWHKIGRVELTEDRIAQIIESLKKSNMMATGVPELPPFANISIKVPDTQVKADTDCELSLTVENTGKGEFYQLVGTSESLIPELDGLKFEFGKLEPEDSLTLTQKFHIPRGQLTGPANVNFKWSELNGYEPNPVLARVMVKGLPRPQFAVSVQVLDDNTGNSVGNGDGRIQGGEAVDLLVTVKNIGDGVARNTKVMMDGIAAQGVIVNIKEQDIGELAVGQSKNARLTITTKKSSEVKKLTPTVRVIDSHLNVEQKEQLALALENELAPSIMAYKTTIYVGEEEVAIRGGAGDDTAIIARAKAGSSLQATGELGQWMRVELPQIGTGWVNRSMIAFESTFQSTITAQVSGGIVEILQKAPPLIAVAKPLGNSKFKSSHVEVSGVIADDQAVSRTEFKLNGREITFNDKRAIGIEAGNQAGAKRELNFAFPVELALGENEIEIVAWDNEGLKSSKVISVSYEKEKGNIYIACIGIDKYKNIPRLKYATADAQTMAEYLQKSLSVPEENVYVLLNEQATLTNIKNTLGVKIRERAGKSDMVIIYFSGHGAPEADPHSPDNDGVNKYLLPIEVEKDALYATALPMDEVRNIFRRLISERVIFLADTCYSGAAGGRTLMPSGTQYRSVNQDNLLARLRDTGKGRVILTASQGSEVSQEKDELGHGVFTYYMLRGLDGKADRNGDNTITISELYEYVSKEVSKETKNTQHPMMKLDEMVGEVVISVLEGK